MTFTLIGGAAAVEIAVAHGGIERAAGPEIERLGGLNVVMTVNQNCGLAGRVKRFAVNQRMHLRRMNFDIFQTGGAQLVGHPSSSFLDI